MIAMGQHCVVVGGVIQGDVHLQELLVG